ncbi:MULTISPECIES: hypothetical protein [Mycoplasma]|uniref:Uncharacterized protein n=2 Tax=Mycoplasma TaxID=2093 RepID=A0A6M4JFH5_9MOLU|nr:MULTISPECIES: hypothetical protein [Mycoplasma]MBU4689509.1 hypothetical protein [Mycoplasma zalophidermidis]MBU4690359.1 hypothetical protein [Mycoplasma miroungigenitalium]MBU4691626.1 hypothetical protein [Mycoplasma miroungigenitalium]MBU4693387.1 hypothetical protein [Mycoplasma zalophidermidis]MCR8966315.1 hypothetical protein [Mycoplasma zalophidermidis]
MNKKNYRTSLILFLVTSLTYLFISITVSIFSIIEQVNKFAALPMFTFISLMFCFMIFAGFTSLYQYINSCVFIEYRKNSLIIEIIVILSVFAYFAMIVTWILLPVKHYINIFLSFSIVITVFTIISIALTINNLLLINKK